MGVGGGLTGAGADILIIDDVVKDAKQADSETFREAAWDWYSSTASTRLMPGGGVLVILTRWHEEDLAGKLLEMAENDPEADQWEVIRFPAIAEGDEWLLEDGSVASVGDGKNVIDFDRAKARLLRQRGEPLHGDRFNVRALHKKQRSMIPRHWLALYQQRPSSLEGNLFKRDWWQYFTYKPTMRFDKLIQSWDFTFDDGDGSDYVVGQVWGARGEEFYLLDQVRGQMDAPATMAAIVALSKKWPKARAKLVEKKANGAAILKMLKGKVSGLIPVEPQGSKVQRASAIAPDVQSGNVYLRDDVPWVSDFIEEHAAFPKGANDDQVDSTSQALIHLTGFATARDKLNALIGRGKKTS
ncbi:Terminase-like family protein [compost metagenome]